MILYRFLEVGYLRDFPGEEFDGENGELDGVFIDKRVLMGA